LILFVQCDVAWLPVAHSANKKINLKQSTVSGPIASTGDVMGASLKIPLFLFFFKTVSIFVRRLLKELSGSVAVFVP